MARPSGCRAYSIRTGTALGLVIRQLTTAFHENGDVCGEAAVPGTASIHPRLGRHQQTGRGAEYSRPGLTSVISDNLT
jgi:hypothetical protein